MIKHNRLDRKSDFEFDYDKYYQWETKAKILGVFDDFEIKTIDNKICLKSYSGKSNNLVVPPVEIIFDNCFMGNSYLENIIISSNTKKIGARAFCECENLKEIKIQGFGIIIDDNAFLYCYKLEKFEIDDFIYKLGREVFGDCFKLRKIDISKGVTHFSPLTFNRCYLTEIVFPESIRKLPNNLFGYSPKFKRITFESKDLEIIPIINKKIFMSGLSWDVDIWLYKKAYNNIIKEMSENDIGKLNFLYID